VPAAVRLKRYEETTDIGAGAIVAALVAFSLAIAGYLLG
jgi:hypothetical protein